MNDATGPETGDRPEAPEVERRRPAPRGARQSDGLPRPARVVVATAEEPVGPWR